VIVTPAFGLVLDADGRVALDRRGSRLSRDAEAFGIARFSHQVTTPPSSIDRTEVGASVGGGLAYPIRDQVLIRGDFPSSRTSMTCCR
jgi:hypothetical protein